MLAVVLASGSARAETLRVFAATSLSDALREVAKRFEASEAAWESKERVQVVLAFAASSDLARQIHAGAPADVFFSADEAKMDVLQKGGQVKAEDRVALLGNQLVVVVPKSSTFAMKAPADLAKVRRLALADPAAVPAGVYAKAWLEKQKQWEAVKGKVVPAQDVRAALSAVETEAADAGIVYRTDARLSQKARVVYEVPTSEGPSIVYPVAKLASTKQAARAKRFVAFLRGREAQAVFERYGFRVLPQNK